jgi:hypothetical protein
MVSLIGPEAEAADEPSFYGSEAEFGPIAVIRRRCHRGTISAAQCRVFQEEFGCNPSIRRRKPQEDREVTLRGRAGGLVCAAAVLLLLVISTCLGRSFMRDLRKISFVISSPQQRTALHVVSSVDFHVVSSRFHVSLVDRSRQP